MLVCIFSLRDVGLRIVSHRCWFAYFRFGLRIIALVCVFCLRNVSLCDDDCKSSCVRVCHKYVRFVHFVSSLSQTCHVFRIAGPSENISDMMFATSKYRSFIVCAVYPRHAMCFASLGPVGTSVV